MMTSILTLLISRTNREAGIHFFLPVAAYRTSHRVRAYGFANPQLGGLRPHGSSRPQCCSIRGWPESGKGRCEIQIARFLWFVSKSYAYLESGHPHDSARSLTTGNRRFPDSKEQLLFRGCSAYQSELYSKAFDIRHPSANSLSLAKPCFNLGSRDSNRPHANRTRP
jgi:hypothetical protein